MRVKNTYDYQEFDAFTVSQASDLVHFAKDGI
jgi:hypothetical protein